MAGFAVFLLLGTSRFKSDASCMLMLIKCDCGEPDLPIIIYAEPPSYWSKKYSAHSVKGPDVSREVTSSNVLFKRNN